MAVKLVSFRIDAELLRHLDAYAEGNRTLFISDALKEHIQVLKEDKTNEPIEQKPQDTGYLNLYIDQLKVRTHQLESEIEYWRNFYKTLQEEYQNQIKDSNKRIDDKFDRIMFYMEESRKNAEQAMIRNNDTNEDDKKRKGLVFQPYRM